MTVTSQNGSLKVVLTPTETVGFGLDEFFFGIDSPTTSNALLNIFKRACNQVRFKTCAERLGIEIYPFLTGGCEILFTPEIEKKKVAVHSVSRNHTIVAEFSNSTTMLDGIEKLFSSTDTNCQSSLYSKNGRYRLTIKPPYARHDLNLMNCEVYTSPIILASTLEHWIPICKNNAIETVGKALKKD